MLSNFYNVYQTNPDSKPRLIGSFHQHSPESKPEVLADYSGMLTAVQHEGPRSLAALRRNPYFKVASRQDLVEGKHPDLIPHVAGNTPQYDESKPVEFDRPSVFHYHAPSFKEPMMLEFRDNVGYLAGKPIDSNSLHHLRDNVLSGRASIRYINSDKILKAESAFQDLSKVDPGLSEALGSVRGAVKSGQIPEEHLRRLQQELFVDPMVPGVGNKKAYVDFMTRPKDGVHIRLDGNDFGSINKIHGHHVGDDAIVTMGKAIRESMDSAVGKKFGKLFRIGGDEFAAHVPSIEHAAKFARELRSRLESIPPVGGTHNLSMSLGFGHNPEHSDQAMIHAKKAKKDAGYSLGQSKTHVHSLVSGSEGPVE